MNTKARYTLLLVQRLVTSLTVTKRDARGFAEECGAELTSYWTERKRSHTPLLPLPPSPSASTTALMYASVCHYNRLINSPLPRQCDLCLIPPAKIISQPLARSAMRHSTRFDSPLRLLPPLPFYSLSIERERERETSPLRFRFIYSFIVLVNITKSTYAIGSVEKEGEEKIVRPYEKKETRLRRRLRGSNAKRQGTARRGEERRFTR